MNLPSLQYIDIDNAITTHIGVDRFAHCSTLLVERDGLPGQRCILLRQQDADANRPSAPGSDTLPCGSLLEAWPVFPNSLLSSEVGIRFPFVDTSSDSPSAPARRSALPCTGELDSPLYSNLEYRLQAPLPGYLGSHLYRAGSHAVVLLEQVSTLEQLDTSLVRELHIRLNATRYRHSVPPEVLIPHFIEGDTPSRSNLRNRRQGRVMMEIQRLNEICHRMAVIGKADLVLSDSIGIAVDALRSSVPVAFVGPIPPLFSALQARALEFLQHGDRQQLLAAQLSALQQIITGAARSHVVIHRRRSLQDMMRPLMQATGIRSTDSAQNTDQMPLNEPDDEADLPEWARDAGEQILLSQRALCARRDRSVRIRSGLQSGRRKFQKFRESPSRFIEDSQHGFLRSLSYPRQSR